MPLLSRNKAEQHKCHCLWSRAFRHHFLSPSACLHAPVPQVVRDFFTDHEGVHLFSWQPSDYGFGVMDRYLECLLRCTHLAAALSHCKVLLFNPSTSPLFLMHGQEVEVVNQKQLLDDYLPAEWEEEDGFVGKVLKEGVFDQVCPPSPLCLPWQWSVLLTCVSGMTHMLLKFEAGIPAGRTNTTRTILPFLWPYWPTPWPTQAGECVAKLYDRARSVRPEVDGRNARHRTPAGASELAQIQPLASAGTHTFLMRPCNGIAVPPGLPQRHAPFCPEGDLFAMLYTVAQLHSYGTAGGMAADHSTL